MGEFTSWFPWASRLHIPDGFGGYVHSYGGVYLLAHFSGTVPPGPADFLDDAVVYVGEGAYLKRRWYDFERSAHLGLLGHSGGHSHRAWATAAGAAWETLHVAAVPIWFDGEGASDAPLSLARRFRLYLEQLILWKLVVHRRGRQGLLNLLNVK